VLVGAAHACLVALGVGVESFEHRCLGQAEGERAASSFFVGSLPAAAFAVERAAAAWVAAGEVDAAPFASERELAELHGRIVRMGSDSEPSCRPLLLSSPTGDAGRYLVAIACSLSGDEMGDGCGRVQVCVLISPVTK
jgi:hypothetical protein